MSSSTTTITPQQIINHRAWTQASGASGCITGRPVPEISFFGFRDVQSWRPADPMNPHCFCFDCRGLWDKDATIDAELVNSGHKWACEAYASLLPTRPSTPVRTGSSELANAMALHSPSPSLRDTTNPPPAPRKVTPTAGVALAHSANSSGWVNSNPSCSCSTCHTIYYPTDEADTAQASGSDLPPPPSRLNLTRQTGYVSAPTSPPFNVRSPSLTPPPVPLLASRTNGGGIDAIVGINTEQPNYASFSEIPMSLPAPRARDIMNETPTERLRNDLANLRADIHRDLIITMDKQRDVICMPEADRATFRRKIRDEEDALWTKLDAVELLLRNHLDPLLRE
jgi:hypothetical protein